MPNFIFDHAWPGMAIWGLLYISDYALTITCARVYRRQETVVFEGSYEITPFFQRDINSLRVVSPRFVFILLLTLGFLGFLWLLNDLSGQVKSGQWWSGQNRPTDVARDVILLAHFLLVRQVRFRAPAPWPAFQDVTVV